MTKHAYTTVTVTMRHPHDTNTLELASELKAYFRQLVEPKLDNFLFERVEVVMSEAGWLEHAKTAAYNMFGDAAEALIEYFVKNKRLPDQHSYDQLSEYGGGNFDPDTAIRELYNLEEEMTTDSALTDAAIIIESEPFKKHSAALDRGKWLEEDDPQQSLKNMADDLYQEVVKEYFHKHILKAASLVKSKKKHPSEKDFALVLEKAKTLDE